MNLYSIELNVVATAYIKARSPTDALAKARKLKGSSPALQSFSPTGVDHFGDLPVSDLQFTDNRLPAISLSPAMTIQGIASDHVELAQKNIPPAARRSGDQ